MKVRQIESVNFVPGEQATDSPSAWKGNGEVKDFPGTLSEYASTLIEIETEGVDRNLNMGSESNDKKVSYKEDRAKRNEQRNTLRQAKKDIDNLEKAMERIKAKAAEVQSEIDERGDEGWSVLADLTDKLNQYTEELEGKENRWLELAELVENLTTESAQT